MSDLALKPLTPLSETDLDHVVAHLRQLYKKYSLAHAVEVGHYLVDHFFGGDYSAARANDRSKGQSLRDLCLRRRQELADLDLSLSTLQRYITASDTWRTLPEQTRERLGLAHLRTLAAVSDLPERQHLAHEAAALHWSREQTALAVAEWKQSQRSGKKKAGRKPQPAVVRAAAAVHAAVRALVKLQGAAASLSPAHRAAYAKEVAAAQAVLAGLGSAG